MSVTWLSHNIDSALSDQVHLQDTVNSVYSVHSEILFNQNKLFCPKVFTISCI